MKAEQNENRLNRQIKFLVEETEETRSLLEEVRTQSEADLDELSRSQAKALKDLQDADTTIRQLQMQQQTKIRDSGDAMFWMKKVELLTAQLQTVEQENQYLKEFQISQETK